MTKSWVDVIEVSGLDEAAVRAEIAGALHEPDEEVTESDGARGLNTALIPQHLPESYRLRSVDGGDETRIEFRYGIGRDSVVIAQDKVPGTVKVQRGYARRFSRGGRSGWYITGGWKKLYSEIERTSTLEWDRNSANSIVFTQAERWVLVSNLGIDLTQKELFRMALSLRPYFIDLGQELNAQTASAVRA